MLVLLMDRFVKGAPLRIIEEHCQISTTCSYEHPKEPGERIGIRGVNAAPA